MAFHGPIAALPTYLSWKSGRECVLRIEKPWDEIFHVSCGTGADVTVLLRELDCRIWTGKDPESARKGPEGALVADFHECYVIDRRVLTAPGDLDQAVTRCACVADVVRERHGAASGPLLSKFDTPTNAAIDARCGQHETTAVVPLDAAWLPVEGEGLGFVARMPGRAREMARDVPLGGGKTARLRMFNVDSVTRLVTISVTGLPAGSLDRARPDRELDAMRDRVLRGMLATLVSERDVRQPVTEGDGRSLPARDVTFKGPNAMAGKARFVVATEDDTLYGLLVLMDGGSPEADFDELVESFSAGSPPRRP